MSQAASTTRIQVTNSEMKLVNRNSLLERNLLKNPDVDDDTLPVPLTRSRKKTGNTTSATKDLTKVAVANPIVMPAVVAMIPLFVIKSLKELIYIDIIYFFPWTSDMFMYFMTSDMFMYFMTSDMDFI